MRKRTYGCLILLLAVPAAGLVALWLILAQPTNQKSPKSDAVVDRSALEIHVRKLSEEFVPRNWAQIGNMNRTADYIKGEFQKVGLGKVSEQWYQVETYRYRNVSLLMGNPTSERIVVGAHYDAYGPHPAADDNASGVAGLIELAKLFAKNPIDTPIEFVGYPLEEPPYFGTGEMGSWKHAKALKKDGLTCKYMISLEMLGYFSDEKGSQEYPASFLKIFYPSRGNFIAVAGNNANRSLIKKFKIGMLGTTELPVKSICGPASLPGIDFSDHRNYWRAGFPAVMITDTAFYRNSAYHTPNDTADRLDYEKMAMVVVAVYEAIRRLES